MGKILVFDLHGTLAESRQPVSKDMAVLLAHLLEESLVAVVSGSTFEQFQNELLASLNGCNYRNLYLYPSEGTELYRWDDKWSSVYRNALSDNEIERIKKAIKTACNNGHNTTTVRGGQVTYAALGFDCPLDVKKHWDPDRTKRKEMRNRLVMLLPEYDITIGGFTSININHRDMGKPQCIRDVCNRMGCRLEDIIYIADEFSDGGDDVPVRNTGVLCIEVSSPNTTMEFVRGYLNGE